MVITFKDIEPLMRRAKVSRATYDAVMGVLLEVARANGKVSVAELGESEAALFAGPEVKALATAVGEWERRGGAYQDVIDALTPTERGPLSAASVQQARRNAVARGELLEEFSALTSSEVAAAAGSRAANRASLANRWRDEGRVFAVRVGDQLLYPGFQFGEDGRPLEVIGAALRELAPVRPTEWQTALWFTTPDGFIGDRRPVDLLTENPKAVIDAARLEADEIVG